MYALLFPIIFVETGVVVMPFLPGDSLLFIVGALCGVGLMNLPLVVVLLLLAAAVLGNQTNYTIGRLLRAARCSSGSSRASSTSARSSRRTSSTSATAASRIVVARFMPFLRTFAPFVAGVAQMTRRKFTFYDVTGGALWVVRPRHCGLSVRQHAVGAGNT